MPASLAAQRHHISRKLLRIYLADHLAGATAGCARIARMAHAYRRTPVSGQLEELNRELQAERAELKRLLNELRLGKHRVRQALAWLGERLGRLKSNGHLFAGSPLTLLLEVELMRSAVAGKLGLWQTLAARAEDLGRHADRFDVLARQAKIQAEQLEQVHEYARARGLSNVIVS